MSLSGQHPIDAASLQRQNMTKNSQRGDWQEHVSSEWNSLLSIADTKQAEGQLPDLIRRLVVASNHTVELAVSCSTVTPSVVHV